MAVDCLLPAAQPPEFVPWTGPWAVGGHSLRWAPSKRAACVTLPQLGPSLRLHSGAGGNPASLLREGRGPELPRDTLRGRPHLFLTPTKGGGINTPYMQEASL